MSQPHHIVDLDRVEPPPPAETEAELLQADVVQWLTEVAMSGFSLDSKQEQKVNLAIATFWTRQLPGEAESFAARLRNQCCDGVRLRPEIRAELAQLTNGSRINAVLSHLGLSNLATLFAKYIDVLKTVLLEQGIDVDCAEGTHRVLS